MASQFPQLSTWTAVGLGGSFAFSYVASLYMFKAGRLVFTARAVEVGPGAERARLENERWRSDPSVIQARLTSVSLSTLASCATVFVILRIPNDTVRALPNLLYPSNTSFQVFQTFSKTFELLGLQFPSHVPLGAWFLAPLLYLGPLYAQMLRQGLPFQRNWSYRGNVRPVFGDWVGIRNFVVVWRRSPQYSFTTYNITRRQSPRKSCSDLVSLGSCGWQTARGQA